MKQALVILVVIHFSESLRAQGTIKQNGQFAQVRGHYRQIAGLDPKPASAKDVIDALKFPYDPVVGERRRSIKPVYLSEADTGKFRIPPVPSNSSTQTKADLAYLYALQQKRTSEEARTSLYMAKVYYNLRVTQTDSSYARYRKNLFHIGRSIGTWFNPDALPITAELMASVWRDASYFIWSFKFKYARVRPYVLDPRLKNLENTDWAAYPSGHAANSYVNAYIYAELAPEFTDVFLKDAYEMAHSREIIGVHFPTDSEASRIFAWQFVKMLFANERFLQDFANARQEWTIKAKEKLE